jgi:ketol-acid reductoisomerase
MRAFGEADGDLRVLDGRRIAFIGYGNQGRAQALNLRDSGIADIRVGTIRDDTWAQAEADGFPVTTVAGAAADADILFLLIPDEDMPEVFAKEIAPHLKPNDAVVFASGYALAFGGLTPPDDIDVVMIAPRMIGRQLRALFEQGKGFYSYVSVEQDASGQAWPVVLALAKGVGTLRRAGGAAFALSARDETILDLFHEQAFGSLLGSMIMIMMEVGQQAGLPPEALVLDYYLSGEMAQTFQTMADLGFYEQSLLHSLTSQYGGMTRIFALDREPLRKHMQKVMDDIVSGKFSEEWAAERAAGYANFEKLRGLAREHNPFGPIEDRLRAAIAEAQGRPS